MGKINIRRIVKEARARLKRRPFSGDYKDAAGRLYNAICDVAECYGKDGKILVYDVNRIPDGNACPRAFLDWVCDAGV